MKTTKTQTIQNELQQALTTAQQWWKKLFYNKSPITNQCLAKEHGLSLAEFYSILRLNLLAPSIQQAIADGTQPATMTLELAKKPFPKSGDEQRAHFGFGSSSNSNQ